MAESDRLEQLAREFTEFGRLPEGPAAPVDFTELLAELARTSLPPTMKARLAAGPGHAGSPGPLRPAPARVQQHPAQRGGGVRGAGQDGDHRRARTRAACGSRSATMARRTARAWPTGSSIPTHRQERGEPDWAWRWSSRPSRCTAARSASSETPGGGATFVVRIGGTVSGGARRSSWWTTRRTSAGCWARCSASEGFAVAEAANGNAALLLLDEADPDVVLLDLMMPPGPDGLETLTQMRDRGRADPGDHDERQGPADRRGAGGQAGRVPVPGEAAQPRGRAGDGARRAGAEPDPGGEPRAARRAGAAGRR